MSRPGGNSDERFNVSDEASMNLSHWMPIVPVAMAGFRKVFQGRPWRPSAFLLAFGGCASHFAQLSFYISAILWCLAACACAWRTPA